MCTVEAEGCVNSLERMLTVTVPYCFSFMRYGLKFNFVLLQL